VHIACFGWVDETSGSGATANHILLDTLLRRGHHVTLFGEQGVVDPPLLRQHNEYEYLGLPQRYATSLHRCSSVRLSLPFGVLNKATLPLFIRRLHSSLLELHGRSRFDVLLFLGLPALCTVPGIPVVEWRQGAPREEALAFRRARKSVVTVTTYLRYCLFSNYYRLDHLWSQLLTRPADLTICGSNWTRNSLISTGFDRKRTAVIPYAVDVDQFPLSEAVSDTFPRLLHLGRCDPRKRIDLLLDAFRLVREQTPRPSLMAIGRPGRLPQITKLFFQEDLSPDVHYLPSIPQTEVPEVLSKTDLLIQTSESEDFGHSVAEALVSGVPVVVGPTNGMADYIDDRSVVFPEYTPKAVAAAVIHALRINPSARPQHRQARRELAAQHFSPESVTAKFEALLAEHLHLR
jgi:glycosyltransferase involved in cell wall biosynthesis